MSNEPKDRKISDLPAKTSLPSDAVLQFVSANANFKITLADFQASLGVTGSIEQAGAVTGVPVLNIAGSVNKIRNLEAGSGILAAVSPENGISLKHNFTEDVTGVKLVTDLTATQPKFRSLVAGSGINIAASNGEIQIALSATPVSTKTVVVNSISDFPAPVAGVITLADNTEYAIRNDVTTANRFVLGDNTVLSGSDNLVVQLVYTGSGAMFSSTNKNWTVKSLCLTFTSGSLIAFTGSGAEVWQMINCRISGATLGTISGFRGIHIDDTQITVTAGGFSFSGTNGVFLAESNLATIDAGTFYDLGTATFSGFSVTEAFVTLNGTSVFLDGDVDSNNITSGNIGSVHNSRFFGAGTPLATIAVGDLRWVFDLNNGIQDSSVDVLMSQVGNVTNTVIAAVNTPVKLAGTWTEEEAFQFTTDATGKMTYDGEKDIELNVTMSFTIAQVSGTNKKLAVYVAKNGAAITNSGAPAVIVSATNFQRVSVAWRVSLSNGDYIESFVENRTDAVDVLITDAVMRVG